MFFEPSKYVEYFYTGLKNIVDWEASYIEARQQSVRSNLPKTVLNTLDGVNGAIKGVTAAIVLGYGAPLPITALVVLNLFPPKTFKYLATKINEWFLDDDEHEYGMAFHSRALSCYNQLNIRNYLPSLETLEVMQPIIINGLTLYQNLLPTSWLQTMVVEAIEQPLCWCNYGKLPDYYTKQSIGVWIWALSGVSGDMLHSSTLLYRSAFASTNQRLTEENTLQYTKPQPYKPLSLLHSNLMAINWINNNRLNQATTLITCLSLINTRNIIPYIVLTGLTVHSKVDAGSTTLNLQSGTPVTVDLTQLTGTNNISNVIVTFLPELTQYGLTIYPNLVGNYVPGQTIMNYQLLAMNKEQVELLSLGIQLPGESLKTTFYVDGLLKWR